MTLFGNIRTMAHVDTEDLEKLTELAHTPVLETEAGLFFVDGLPNRWETCHLDDLEPQVAAACEWATSMLTQCSCGYRAPSSNIGLGPHVKRMITQARDGRIELT